MSAGVYHCKTQRCYKSQHHARPPHTGIFLLFPIHKAFMMPFFPLLSYFCECGSSSCVELLLSELSSIQNSVSLYMVMGPRMKIGIYHP
ncbi:hypothetical protein Q3G72_002086 [Acer saccharum]|nr:hypothetical protein Q3G72_002086 [Acer saccharum]